MEILEDYKEKFGTDFAENKKVLEGISIVRSKELKNELAGFITKFIKREIREKKEKEEQLANEAQKTQESNELTESSETTSEPPPTADVVEESPKENSE